MTSIHTEREKIGLDNNLQLLDTVLPKSQLLTMVYSKSVYFSIHSHAQEEIHIQTHFSARRTDY